MTTLLFKEIQRKLATTQTWGLDSRALDEWLENDLHQSGIISRTLQDNQCSADTCIKKEDTYDNSVCTSVKEDNTHKNIKTENTTPATPAKIDNLQSLGSLDAKRKLLALRPDLLPLMRALSFIGQLQRNSDQRKSIGSNTSITTSLTKRSRSSPSLKNSDGSDDNRGTALLKRQRNTDAARRSRLRKMQKMDTLEAKVKELEFNNQQLKLQEAIMESKRNAAELKARQTRERVLALEAQLAESHQTLIRGFKKEDVDPISEADGQNYADKA
ncbi:basic-leucine zipper transcription factor [Phycomyces blakesleeanus]|uniref:Basic-leucine zipper transcription factor n=2 Tax=Phycomyces blakesleeanus TaxID=4837 RepID=A0A163B954_PHYB8|nr:basic-leucine zipper transcription factor [Phycomyces blakesleeanus NRRL 1555(-)]OAD78911.1 basic-leucine zipper transcription factor [Phycomyces blakesleeanus NRRL 1555(-)]|eukprot:XP_018296951.1 basic-leucine zipper transcription factor [Phycomyces blakesleeanus NRRL 1555(-)]